MKSKYWIKSLAGTLVFFAIIFISAGRIDYWQGLVYVATGLLMMLLNFTVLQIDSGLLKERSKPGEGAKKWDKSILGLSFLTTLAMYCIAGLDSGRYHWSPDFHWSLTVMGIMLTASGQLLFLIAQKQNKFFSSTVRIQTDRGHKVCDTGLYKIVRHPAYMSSFIQLSGFPLLFGSLWSIIPVGLSAILLIARTQLEDQLLKKELTGFPEYAKKIQYRLIPFLW
jgi:protein-S-isoprenylcysteine O-methyltransferase Ste14